MGTEETWKLIVGNKRMIEVSVITVKDKVLNKVGNCLSKEKCSGCQGLAIPADGG